MRRNKFTVLTNPDNETVTVRKNHGGWIKKPKEVIYAELDDDLLYETDANDVTGVCINPDATKELEDVMNKAIKSKFDTFNVLDLSKYVNKKRLS